MISTQSQQAAWYRINESKVKKQINNTDNMGDLSRRIVELLDKKLILGKIIECGVDKDAKKKTVTLTVRFEHNPY